MASLKLLCHPDPHAPLMSICSAVLPARLLESGSLGFSCLYAQPHLPTTIPPPHFGMPVPGICSNSSHPVGIGMYPLPPIPLSSLQPVSVYLMYASTYMKQPTWTPHRRFEAYAFYWLVTTKSFPSCSASWSWRTTAVGYTTARPKTTLWITGNYKLLLITAQRPIYSVSELKVWTLIRSTSSTFLFSLTCPNVDSGKYIEQLSSSII